MSLTSRVMLLGRIFQYQIRRTLTSQTEILPKDSDNSAEGKPVLVSHIGPITLIGINRTETKNSLDNTISNDLCEALSAFEENNDSSIGIIYGVGGNFCSGFDLNEIAKNDKDVDMFPHFGSLWRREILTNKPMIASISGYAVGAGFELALMCDLRIVEESARMGFFNRRLGIPTMCGGTVRLSSMIGYSRAMDMILTGREITGGEAFDWGIANRLVAPGAGLGQCVTLAQSIQKFPQPTLLADRASLHYATFVAKSMEESLEFEKDNSTDLLMNEGIKGAKKFVDGFGRHGKSKNINQYNNKTFRELSNEIL